MSEFGQLFWFYGIIWFKNIWGDWVWELLSITTIKLKPQKESCTSPEYYLYYTESIGLKLAVVAPCCLTGF